MSSTQRLDRKRLRYAFKFGTRSTIIAHLHSLDGTCLVQAEAIPIVGKLISSDPLLWRKHCLSSRKPTSASPTLVLPRLQYRENYTNQSNLDMSFEELVRLPEQRISQLQLIPLLLTQVIERRRAVGDCTCFAC